MIRVLSVASECAPLVKTGGLADVVGALPGALRPCGVEVRTLLPGYPAVRRRVGAGTVAWEEADLFGGPARLLAGQADGLDLLILEAPHLFEREGSIYLGPDGRDWEDNSRRFAALSWVGAEIAAEGIGGWRPDVLHCHDWQAGFAPLYLRERSPAADARSILTIHNVAFQGFAPADQRTDLRLPPDAMHPEGYEFWGRISALKAGLIWADRVTTVSPTYAAELMRGEFGMGLDGVLRSLPQGVAGILNGVDLEQWSPPYDRPEGKKACTTALRQELGLPDTPGPLCVVISRLTVQKGLDLLLDVLPDLLERGGQLALLGAGEPELEIAFREAADRWEGVAVRIGYDAGLAERLYAGGEAILVPSRFEPCGLTQLYGLRFGTIPVVALTGGLADTVIPATPAGLRAGVANGLQFHPIDADAFGRTIARLVELHRDRRTWRRMQRNAMRQPVGWDASATEYAALYRDVLATER